MTRLNYLRAALVLPFLPPLIAWLSALAGLSNALGEFLIFSMLFGGVALLTTVAILLAASVMAKVDTFEKWWFFSPFLMALVCGICAFGASIYRGFTFGWELALIWPFLGIWLVLGIYSLIVGYVYVLFASALYVVLLKVGAIKGETIQFRLDAIPDSSLGGDGGVS